MQSTGESLVDGLKNHVLKVMSGLQGACLDSAGVGYRTVEEAGGLGVGLDAQDGWLT
jgi:hypothetical protein